MTSFPRKQDAVVNHRNLYAQVAVTHNPLFPFSSPNIGDRSSLTSNQTEFTIRSQDNLDSLEEGSTKVSGTKQNDGKARSHPAMDDQDRSMRAKPQTTAETGKLSTRKRPRPGLHIVTDFSQPQSRSGNVVLSQVAVKYPKQTKGRVHSVVSQKGINELSTPLRDDASAEVLSDLKDLIKKYHEKKAGISTKPKRLENHTRKKAGSSPTRSTVLFGLQVPEHEASFHQGDDKIQSSITLVTPITPRIVVAPAGAEPGVTWDHSKPAKVTRGRRWSSPTSIYSKFISQYHPPGLVQGPSSPPAITRGVAAAQGKRRLSSESRQQILADSCDTARPKSQGWWNLVLSPILSRVGTIKKTHSEDNVPPVPPIPTENEKNMMLQTPATNISPETPRRLGLAHVRSSTWSQWTDCEGAKDLTDSNTSSPEEENPMMPKDHPTNEHQTVFTHDYRNEGMAAEYYHACAVEQLANITYFECINHSCAEHLPKLKSIYRDRNQPTVSSFVAFDSVETGHFDKDLAVESGHRSIGNVHPTSRHSSTTEHEASNFGLDNRQKSQGPTSPTDSEIVSPNIREANTAAFSKAKTVHSREPSPVLVASTVKSNINDSNANSTKPFYNQPIVESPGPMSPEASRVMAPREATPMAPVESLPAEKTAPLVAPVPQASHALVAPYQPYPAFADHSHAQPVVHHVFALSPQQLSMNHGGPLLVYGQAFQSASPGEVIDANVKNGQDRAVVTDVHSDKSKKEEKHRKIGIFGFCCCFHRNAMGKRKNKWWAIGLFGTLLVVIIFCILFAILFTRGNGEASPIASQWLNLSGYPPMPTGISTIAQPNLSASQNKCTSPTTLWSCSLPKEYQAAISPNEPDQPNFRFQIRFYNGTVPANMTIPLNKRNGQTSADDLFVPNPTPPGQPDQLFLGSTTDNTTNPFDGEATPFFITFMRAVPNQPTSAAVIVKQRMVIRQTNSSDLLNSIPAPSFDTDGTAAPASLLPTTPLPISQPVKLYNRGLPDEHYGFYMYYDKSVFLSAISLQNGTAVNDNDQSLANADQNGGSTKSTAHIRCTWSQTRFVVKMFTSPKFGASLLSSPPVNVTASDAKENKTSSATNFIRPGSFPFPTTIVLDRHGGDINKKLIYCYGMSNGGIISDEKILVSEDRAFGGVIVNAAPSILNSGSSNFNSSVGGIDGGTGGCGCTWQNWA